MIEEIAERVAQKVLGMVDQKLKEGRE